MKLPHDTWVLVLDGEKYLMLKNQGNEQRIDLKVLDHEVIRNPATRDQGSERPGRRADTSFGNSAVGQTDWHTLEKERFASDIAARLKDWALQNRFDKLVVCADPRTLGNIRPEYHVEVERRLIAEIPKDLTALPVEEIERILTIT